MAEQKPTTDRVGGGRSWLVGIPLVGIAAVGVVTVGPTVVQSLQAPRPSEQAQAVANASPPSPVIRFGRDIRPLLSDRCFLCHGPDAAQRKAELRLDKRSIPIERGVLVPGAADQSELMRRIASTDSTVRMPPAESNKKPLSPEEQALIEQWIVEGATYEPHWAFTPPVRPEFPEVKNESWCRNPIDRFILARLEDEGIEPSTDADDATVVRRMFLDLMGLPPTPEELDAYLADGESGAYERLVDRVFASEPYRSRYAERMATPWLDQSRYADTIGIHTDNGRQMWLWRDWVLDAYRTNMPFDRFASEQLAGDLMPDATATQRIATGFNRNHVITDEGGAINEEYLIEYAVDRTVTTGAVFLGMTFGCARCHDHKFDPVTQDEFYGLYAFFNSNEEPGLYTQTPDSRRAYEPFLKVPSEGQTQELDELAAMLKSLEAELAVERPEDDAQYAAFLAEFTEAGAVTWDDSEVVEATSTNGASMELQDDRSIRVTGPNPKEDVHAFRLRTDGTDLHLLMLEVLTDSGAQDRLGRASNGNAVLDGFEAEVISVTDPQQRRILAFDWVWADFSQPNGNYEITNVIDTSDTEGWAVGGHTRPGSRVALLMAREPFGFEGGTEIAITMRYTDKWPQHTFARVRFNVGAVAEHIVARLPAVSSRWVVVGPFPEDKEAKKEAIYDKAYGPETLATIDFKENFGFGNQYWRFDGSLVDGRPIPLAAGRGVNYVGKTVYAPTAREVPVSLGSDDGFAVFVNGTEVAARRVDRGVAPDQDSAVLPLTAGPNAVVIKIVNTGGPSGYFYRAESGGDELAGDLVAGVIPAGARPEELEQRLESKWRISFLPRYRETKQRMDETAEQIATVDASIPLTMIMKELDEPRPAFVLQRGRYDAPDESRPVSRGVPAALGAIPGDAPADRLGLAQWMTSPENPLVARVAVNRLWELAVGTGLVKTSEDFGLQGDWPSHPQLLDWLAVEFRESGWNVQHVLKLIVTSSTYRQRSAVRSDLAEIDPANRLLASYPRRRLSAEQIRDLALYVSGLLVESRGGPSVKPYQPPGLWREVAMVQSNTRNFERGSGDDLWRRSLYTYWKRASPPPAMQIFDAPTREFCTIRRALTNTPLQALVLWNDEQFVEAARGLAARTVEQEGDDVERVRTLYRRCTGRDPDLDTIERIRTALAGFRDRYTRDEAEATALLAIGETEVPEHLTPSELAAWTMIASAILNLYETTTHH